MTNSNTDVEQQELLLAAYGNAKWYSALEVGFLQN